MPRMSSLAAARARFRGLDWVFLLLVMLLTALFVHWRSTQEILSSDNFLHEDESVGMLVTDVLLHGGTLYKDIAYPYGYIPAYLHVAAARAFGHTVATYLGVFLPISVAVLGMLYVLLRRVLRPWTAFLFTAGVMIPQTISPGAMNGDGISNLAYPLEKIPLVAVALLWREPRRQLWWRALLLGICLGGMQGIKFGTGIVLGMALALVELFSWYRSGADIETGRIVLRNNLAVLGGFLLVQSVWVGLALASLPRAIAHDVLWPTYMYANYAAFKNQHYPGWYGRDFFVCVEMIPLLGIVGSLWWLGKRLSRRRTPVPPAPGAVELQNGGGILILLVFYVLASFILFKGNWHFFSFAWVPVLGGVYLLLQPVRAVRRAVVVLWGAGLGRFLLIYFLPATPLLFPVQLDDGERLWVSAASRHEITNVLAAARAPMPAGPGAGKMPPVVFYPLGAGYHVFFHVPRQGRNTWYAPGLVRPYDEARIAELARTARWVVRPYHPPEGPITPDPATWDRTDYLQRFTFDGPLRGEIQSRLRLEREIDGTSWVFSPSP